METSEHINELATALAKAQGEMHAAERGRENPFFKSKYATLSHVREAMREPCAKNGLSVCQSISNAERGVRITTMLMHSSGQWIRDVFDVPAGKLDAQGLGSSATYGLRYSLQAIVGIAPDDASDDDGNHAAVHAEQPKQQRRPPKTEPTDTRKQAREYEAAMSPEELEQFTTTRNTFVERISKADSLMTLDKIADDLKTSPERIKGVVRPLWAARKKVIQGDQLPPGAGEENP